MSCIYILAIRLGTSLCRCVWLGLLVFVGGGMKLGLEVKVELVLLVLVGNETRTVPFKLPRLVEHPASW